MLHIAPCSDSSAQEAAKRYDQHRVIRRNGDVVGFDPFKIAIALSKAFLAVKGNNSDATNIFTSTAPRKSKKRKSVTTNYPYHIPVHLRKLPLSQIETSVDSVWNFASTIDESRPENISQFSEKIGIPTELLLEQLAKAGFEGLSSLEPITDAHQDGLLNWLSNQHHTTQIFEDTRPLKDQLLIVREVNDELISRLARQPQLCHELPSRKFEELVAELLERQGCKVTLTQRTRDGGYDIIGTMNTSFAELVFLAECKRYSPSNKVGVEVVRSLYGVVEAEKRNLGLIITTSSFTKPAQDEKMRIGNRIQLHDYNQLCEWLTVQHSNNMVLH